MTAEPQIRATLRTAIVGALKNRDRQAAAVYRSTLSAIDNAESVPVDDARQASAVESSPESGHTEMPRRVLVESEMIRIIENEAQQCYDSADQVAETAAGTAEKLRNDAALLEAIIRSARPH